MYCNSTCSNVRRILREIRPEKHLMSYHITSYQYYPHYVQIHPTATQVFNADLLIPIPEIKTLRLTPEHEFLIIGSDGLWDVISSAEAVLIAR